MNHLFGLLFFFFISLSLLGECNDFEGEEFSSCYGNGEFVILGPYCPDDPMTQSVVLTLKSGKIASQDYLYIFKFT